MSDLKLFQVSGEFFSNYFGVSVPFTEFVASYSTENALGQIFDRMENHRKENMTKADELRTLEAEGKVNLDSSDPGIALTILAIGNTRHPRNVEKWKATEVEVSGYRIILESAE